MGVALGPGYTDRFLRGFLSGSERLFLVAEREGRVVGYVVGRPVSGRGSDDRRLLPWVAFGLVRNPRLIRRDDIRGELLRRFRSAREGSAEPEPDLPGPVFSLVGIGTDPAVQGRGVGRALVEAFQAHVIEHGYGSGRLSVYRDNAAARHVYERAGWTPLDHPTNPTVLYYAWVPEPA